jgi:hypothetical protein
MNLEEKIERFKKRTHNLFNLDRQFIEKFNELILNSRLNHLYSIAFFIKPDGVFIEDPEILKGKTKINFPILGINFLNILGAQPKKDLKEKNLFYIVYDEEDIRKELPGIVKETTKKLIDKDLIEFDNNYNIQNMILMNTYIHEFTHSVYHSVESFLKNNNKFNTYYLQKNNFINEVIAYTMGKLGTLWDYEDKSNLENSKRNLFELFKKENSRYKIEIIYNLASVYFLEILGKNKFKLNIIDFKEKNNKLVLLINFSNYINIFNFLYNTLNEIVNKRMSNINLEENLLYFLKEFVKKSEEYIKEIRNNKKYEEYLLTPLITKDHLINLF